MLADTIAAVLIQLLIICALFICSVLFINIFTAKNRLHIFTTKLMSLLGLCRSLKHKIHRTMSPVLFLNEASILFILLLNLVPRTILADSCLNPIIPTMNWACGSGTNVVCTTPKPRNSWGELARDIETETESTYAGFQLYLNSPTNQMTAPICYKLYINGEIWPRYPYYMGYSQNCGAYFYPMQYTPSDVSCPINYVKSSTAWECVPVNPASEVCPSRLKDPGPPDFCPVGNPINQATGNKFLIDADYRGVGKFPLVFERTYNSRAVSRTRQGTGWTNTYDRAIVVTSPGVLPNAVNVNRTDGKVYSFWLDGDSWVTSADISDQLTARIDLNGVLTGWIYVTGQDEVETYDISGRLVSISDRAGFIHTLHYDLDGRLVSVVDAFGQTLSMSYGATGNLATLVDPAGGIYSYSYDDLNNLVSVSYPDSTPSVAIDNPKKIYLYNEPDKTSGENRPHHLTGIIDENGSRFATYGYDTEGRANLSEHAGGVGRVTLVYNDDGTTIITDALGKSRVQHFVTILGRVKSSGISDGCADCGGAFVSVLYDANGNPVSRTDFSGNTTIFEFDRTRNLEISRTEAYGTPEARTFTTDWHSKWRVPVRITEPGRVTIFTYDDKGRMLSRNETAAQ